MAYLVFHQRDLRAGVKDYLLNSRRWDDQGRTMLPRISHILGGIHTYHTRSLLSSRDVHTVQLGMGIVAA
jgi:hypothetical protein